MRAIAKIHAEWAAKCLPADAPQIQRQEMERGFYSGFLSALVYQTTHLACIENDDKAVEELEALHQECRTYFQVLAQAGRDISKS